MILLGDVQFILVFEGRHDDVSLAMVKSSRDPSQQRTMCLVLIVLDLAIILADVNTEYALM